MDTHAQPAGLSSDHTPRWERSATRGEKGLTSRYASPYLSSSSGEETFTARRAAHRLSCTSSEDLHSLEGNGQSRSVLSWCGSAVNLCAINTRARGGTACRRFPRTLALELTMLRSPRWRPRTVRSEVPWYQSQPKKGQIIQKCTCRGRNKDLL